MCRFCNVSQLCYVTLDSAAVITCILTLSDYSRSEHQGTLKCNTANLWANEQEAVFGNCGISEKRVVMLAMQWVDEYSGTY